jgi:hypothetical protein
MSNLIQKDRNIFIFHVFALSVEIEPFQFHVGIIEITMDFLEIFS